MSEVAVVIPNFNGMIYLEDCLAALQNQSNQEFEVILVDNGSKDESVSYVKEHYPQVRILELEHNYGFCRAVNAGIRATEAPFTILLNNDTKVDSGFVKALLEGIKKRPGCFSCSAKMLKMSAPDQIDDAGDYYCALGWAYAWGQGQPEKNYNRPRKIFSACGGAAIYRNAVFWEIGFFDEKHFAYLEDMDIGYRAKIYGYENYYLPEAVVYHVGSGTTGSRYNEFKIRYSSRNNIYMIYKNMPLLQILINMPCLLAGFLIKIAFFTAKGFGSEYRKGLRAGIRMSLHGEKVKYQKKHFRNYCKIQVELFVNLGKRLGNRLT